MMLDGAGLSFWPLNLVRHLKWIAYSQNQIIKHSAAATTTSRSLVAVGLTQWNCPEASSSF
jgi:hypothetical protein